MASIKAGLTIPDWIILTLKKELDRELGDWPYWRDMSAAIELRGPKSTRYRSMDEVRADRRKWDRDNKRKKRAKLKGTPYCPTCSVPMAPEPGGGHRCATCGKLYLLAL